MSTPGANYGEVTPAMLLPGMLLQQQRPGGMVREWIVHPGMEPGYWSFSQKDGTPGGVLATNDPTWLTFRIHPSWLPE